MSHHDFRHSGRESHGMSADGYLDIQSAMINDHGIMGQMDSHLMSGCDTFSQHQMMHMYGDPSMAEIQEGEFT